MTFAQLKYAVLFVGLLAPLSAHAEMGDPDPGMHGSAPAPLVVDTAPARGVDVTPTGSIEPAPCDAHHHPKKHAKCPAKP